MNGVTSVDVDVKEVVDSFTSAGDVFSAYDVTKKVNSPDPVARHFVIKGIVHSLYLNGELNAALYSRELITLDVGNDDAEAWVYFPSNKTAYDHPLAKSQSASITDNGSGVPVLDLGDGTTDPATTDDSITVEVTEAHRIQIPKKILNKVTVTSTNEYNVEYDGKTHFCKANADGRVRITDSGTPSGAKLNVSVQNNQVHISPA